MGGAWECSLFRNERPDLDLSSTLITEAVGITRWYWPTIPDLGFITFIDRSKTRPKRDPGRCYRKAGWVVIGETKGGLVALGQRPEDMPEPVAPINGTEPLFRVALPGA